MAKCSSNACAVTSRRGAPKAKHIAKKSLGKHRKPGGSCSKAKKQMDQLDELVRAAPPPLSAEEALAHVRNVKRSGI